MYYLAPPGRQNLPAQFYLISFLNCALDLVGLNIDLFQQYPFQGSMNTEVNERMNQATQADVKCKASWESILTAV